MRIFFSACAWQHLLPAFIFAMVTVQHLRSLAQTDFTDDNFVALAERFHCLFQNRSTKILTGREIKL
jgi:meiotically up-regulated gene 157 (Mug157) protein